MGAATTQTDTALADINITPLCDVLLVLLIIFMVTAPLLTQGIDVNLPQTKAPEVQRTQDDIIITIKPSTTGAQFYLGDNDTAIATHQLESTIKQALATREENDVFLKADHTVPYGDVAKVMAIAKLAGATRIGMMTQPETRK